MFFNKNEDEADFCESYKSQVLGQKGTEKSTSFFATLIQLLTILILLAIIIGLSFYGYNYFMKMEKVNDLPLPPVSIQISDEDLVVEAEDSEVEEVSTKEEEGNAPISLKDLPKSKVSDMDKLTTDVERELMQSKIQEKRVKPEEINNRKIEVESLEVSISTPESEYLEALADLSKEIDKEKKE